ncbi:MAG: hypothetical protein IAE97_13950 [Chthoniobacterales bacterium]|nr:hypothetical protein [Chthoniobacterales bacterium]
MKKALPSSLLCVLAFAAPALAGDDIAVSAVPKNVAAAVQSYFPSAKIISAKTDTKKDLRYYELRALYRDLLLEIDVTSDGRVTEVESKKD